MKRLATLSLAAGAALLPASALAMQQDNGANDLASAYANASGGATGTSWQAGAAAPAAPAADAASATFVPAAAAQGSHQVHRFHRVHRGWRMPPFWVGPRFRIVNWRHYGFAPPPPGGWWIRYYDDAVLVGPDGVVRDGRYDVDWDRYGERWERDPYGIPSYVGSGDYAPDGDDYAYVENYEGPPAGAWAHGAPAQHGYGWSGYGYGYAYGPVVVTETITTTGPAYAHKGRHEKRVVTHRKRHHHDGADCDCPEHAAPPPPPPPPAPPPPIGERG